MGVLNAFPNIDALDEDLDSYADSSCAQVKTHITTFPKKKKRFVP